MREDVKRKIKGAARSRTIWASVGVAVLGGVVSSFPLLKDHIDAEVYSFTLFGLSVLFSGLRVVTTKPLDER